MPRVNVRLDDELHDQMEREIESSTTIENPSQYIRAAVREFQREEDGEFDQAF